MQLKGYVIIPPVNSWDDPEKVIPLSSYNSFGITPMEAWMRHAGISEKNMETGITIQRSHNRGYRLKEATLTIEVKNEHSEDYFDHQSTD